MKAPNTEILDEFGRLYQESQLWAPKKKRLDELATEIRASYPDLPAEQGIVAAGRLYEVQVGPMSVEKSWTSMSAVCKAVGGVKQLLKICTVTFKALSEAIGKGPAEALQIEARTGYRTVKAVAKLSQVIELPRAA